MSIRKRILVWAMTAVGILVGAVLRVTFPEWTVGVVVLVCGISSVWWVVKRLLLLARRAKASARSAVQEAEGR